MSYSSVRVVKLKRSKKEFVRNRINQVDNIKKEKRNERVTITIQQWYPAFEQPHGMLKEMG